MKKNLYILLLFVILVTPALLQAAQPVWGWKANSAKTTLAAHDDSQDNDKPGRFFRARNGNRPKLGQLIRNGIENAIDAANDRNDNVKNDSAKNIYSEGIPAGNNERAIVVVPSSKQYVLLIGVNEYTDPITSLRFCVNDMHLLAESFMNAGVPKENIILLTDDSREELRPTGANIRKQIEYITNLVGPNDMLIIAFSGHGVMVDGNSYLCPSDTDLDDINSIVSREWAFDLLENCKAKRKVFIIDACRNEVTFDGQKTFDSVCQKSHDSARTIEGRDGTKNHGFILMASCDKTQRSWEDSNLEHGVFTYYLAKGLAGAACNKDGDVSIFSLFLYASEKTEEYVCKYHEARQVPTMMQSGETTNFILTTVEPPKHGYGDENTDNYEVPRWVKYGFDITYVVTDGKISIRDIYDIIEVFRKKFP